METTSHQNGPHSGETPERQVLSEIQSAIKRLSPKEQSDTEIIAENFRRVLRVDGTGCATMAFALVGAEMAAR